MTIPLKLGIDVGSTTVKAVVWDGARRSLTTIGDTTRMFAPNSLNCSRM